MLEPRGTSDLAAFFAPLNAPVAAVSPSVPFVKRVPIGEKRDKSKTVSRNTRKDKGKEGRDVGPKDPEYFTCLRDFADGYPQRTNIFCWWCCHPFDTQPIGIPFQHDGRANCYKVIGCFCSFACSLAYIKSESRYQKRVQYATVAAFYKYLTGDTKRKVCVEKLTTAPPRCALRIFGGPQTIQEFRKAAENEVEYNVIFSPQIPLKMFCEQTLHRKNKMKLEIQLAKPPLLGTSMSGTPMSGTPTHNVAETPGPVDESNTPLTQRKRKQRSAVSQLISYENAH